jgi:hypothetical protein
VMTSRHHPIRQAIPMVRTDPTADRTEKVKAGQERRNRK